VSEFFPGWWGTFNATTFQAACNAAESAGGGSIKLRQGTFDFSTEIEIPLLVGIQGAGKGATTLNYTGSGIALSMDRSDESGDGWLNKLSDFKLMGNDTGTVGIYMEGTRHSIIENVDIRDFTTAGVEMVPCTSPSVQTNLNTLRNVNIYGCGYALKLENLTYCNFENIFCYDSGNAYGSLYIDGGAGLVFQKCIFQTKGVHLYYSGSYALEYVSFLGCQWTDITETNLLIDHNVRDVDILGGSIVAPSVSPPATGVEINGDFVVLKPNAIRGVWGTQSVLLGANADYCTVGPFDATVPITDNGDTNIIHQVATYGVYGIPQHEWQYFSDLDETPSVKGKFFFKVSYSQAKTITMLDDGVNGQSVKIIMVTGNITWDFTGTNMKGNSGADWSPTAGDWMEGIFDGTNWYFSVHDCTA